MRHFFLTLVALLAMYGVQAQVNPHAIGVRLGGDGGDNNDVELSYQQGLGGNNRLELDLGFGGNKSYNRLFVAGIYHWNWNLTSGLNWYIGPGATLGLYSFDSGSNDRNNEFNIGVGGQIGLEYDFNTKGAPLLISLDTRPMWHFVGDYNAGFGWGAALGIRYTW